LYFYFTLLIQFFGQYFIFFNMLKTIPQLFNEYVDRHVEQEFKVKSDITGTFKMARKAELKQKLDGFMLTFIKECIQNEDL